MGYKNPADRRRKERERYASDPEYRKKKKDRAAARRATPEGQKYNAEQAKAWREENPEKNRANIKRWQVENAEYLRAYWRRYKRKRFAEDPGFKVKEYMRRRVRLALQNQSTTKDSTTMSLVGCSVQELVEHLEAGFQPGMTWDNYGAWHVDHIRELCDFDLSDKTEQAMAFHFTNLRPLWAVENQARPNRDAQSKTNVR